MPEYLGALLSASLSHSADRFRKLYYDNGSHAGCIIYVGATQVDLESMAVVKKTLADSRGKGAFKNLLIHSLAALPGAAYHRASPVTDDLCITTRYHCLSAMLTGATRHPFTSHTSLIDSQGAARRRIMARQRMASGTPFCGLPLVTCAQATLRFLCRGRSRPSPRPHGAKRGKIAVKKSCKIVQQRKKAWNEEKPHSKGSFPDQWGLMDSRRKTAATSPLLTEPIAADTVSSSSSSPSSRTSMPLRFKKAIATKKAVRLLPSLKIWPREIATRYIAESS